MAHAVKLQEVCDRALNAQVLARFIDGYDQVRGSAPLPHFEAYMLHESSIDLLTNATLFEPRGEGEVFYRFCGTSVVERSGGDLTGQNLIAIWPEVERTPFYQHLRALLATPCGNFAKLEQVFKSGERVRGESLTLPVFSEQNPSGVFLLACTLMDEKALRELEPGDYVKDIEWRASYFVDVGQGVPEAAPTDFFQNAV